MIRLRGLIFATELMLALHLVTFGEWWAARASRRLHGVRP